MSPSTVDRVLARNGLALPGLARPPRSAKKPWPEWVQWRPNQLWCWDASHFSACTASPVVYGIVDVVSRKWVASLLCAEQTGTQVKVVFLAGLEAEGLLADLEWRLDAPGDVDLDDEHEGRGEAIRQARRDGSHRRRSSPAGPTTDPAAPAA